MNNCNVDGSYEVPSDGLIILTIKFTALLFLVNLDDNSSNFTVAVTNYITLSDSYHPHMVFLGESHQQFL